MSKSLFGKTSQGKEVYLYSLTNKNGMKAEMIDFGAILVNLYVPDKNGQLADVCLGYDKVSDYENNPPFFGSTIGPSANRIANAEFQMDGETYHLAVNDGPNNLHSDMQLGYHKKIWNVIEGEDSIQFSIEAPDMEMGFPGNKKVTVTYTLTDSNEIKIHYHVTSDQKTFINMTNHSYFNLSGNDCGKSIEDHILTLKASNYTPVVKGAIPTGEIAPVKGTPMDFTSPKRIGDDIRANFEQLKLTKGYDHNFVIDDFNGKLQMVANVEDPKSGRVMKVSTDLPGVQFYAGNCISKHKGKRAACYDDRYGMCLETQYYPNTPNVPAFPQAFFGPDRVYDTETIYQFEAK